MSSKLPVNLEDLLHQHKVEGDQIEYKAGWNPNETITPKVDEKTSEKTSEKIISLMRGNKNITISEISEAINRTTRAVEMQIAKLKEEGAIERIGPDMGGYWIVKEESEK